MAEKYRNQVSWKYQITLKACYLCSLITIDNVDFSFPAIRKYCLESPKIDVKQNFSDLRSAMNHSYYKIIKLYNHTHPNITS